MKNAYIIFQSREDAVLGFQELVQHCDVMYLSKEIFCVPWSSLAHLDSCQVQYRFATDEDLTNVQPVWTFTESTSRS